MAISTAVKSIVNKIDENHAAAHAVWMAIKLVYYLERPCPDLDNRDTYMYMPMSFFKTCPGYLHHTTMLR